MVAVENINWLFGRGLSIACNLAWTVPPDIQNTPREEKINRIKELLRQEMASEIVDTSLIRRFLQFLADQTAPNWRNKFITTNWDYLLQREILALNLNEQPNWLANSHVFHLNGTVEELEDNANRSPFLLEEDPENVRCVTPEANIIYNQMIWDRVFVVVGMSFECDTDKFLLNALGRVEDDLPIGESTWIVVNRNNITLEQSCQRIKQCLPRSILKCVHSDINDWVESKFPELQECGVITC